MKGFSSVLGTDIAHIKRFNPLENQARFVRLAQRILHPSELEDARSRKLPISISDNRTSLYDWLTTVGTLTPSKTEHEASSASVDSGRRSREKQARYVAKWFAGRWAAKEAAKKAWGADLIGWKDVRVEPNREGSRSISTTSNSADSATSSRPVRIVCQLYAENGADQPSEDEAGEDNKIQIEHLRQEGLLSISHDGEYAVATVIADPLDERLRKALYDRARSSRNKVEDKTSKTS